MMNAFRSLCIMAYCQVRSFVKEEKGAVDIVAVVVLIGIAVVLAVLFRTRIQALLETLMDTIEGNATSAVS